MEALTIDKHEDMLQLEQDYNSEINAGELVGADTFRSITFRG